MAGGGNHGSDVKELAIDLEVIGCGPVGCHFPYPPLFLPRFVLYPVFECLSACP